MADMSNEAFFLTDSNARYRYVNDRSITVTGYSREELLGMTLFDLDPEYPRDQFYAIVDALGHGAIPPFEARTRSRDGSYHPCEVSIDRIDVDGETYVFGVVRDITERKQMEAAQQSFTQRMLQTLESERERVARELHDDVGQAVATVGNLIRSLEEGSGAVAPEARPALEATHAMIRELAGSVARIVQDYHPAELLGLGLDQSIRSHAEQFAKRHGLALRLVTTPMAGLLQPEQEVHVYRVVQEALANVAHHADAHQVTIRLARRARHVVVSVRDDGAGFDPAAVPGTVGLGLVTMRERAGLMRATLEVRSSPGGGTEIQLAVPLAVAAPRRQRPRVSKPGRTAPTGTTRVTAPRAARHER